MVLIHGPQSPGAMASHPGAASSGAPPTRDAASLVPLPDGDASELPFEHLYFTDPLSAARLNRFYSELAQKLLQLDGDLSALAGRVVTIETVTTRQAETAALIFQRSGCRLL